MNDKMKTLQLKQFNKDYPITLTYDKCKSGESQYGPWNLYGVKYEDVEQGIFDEDRLHDMLKQYGKGAKLVIRKNQDNEGRHKWQVVASNGSNPSPDQTVINYLDDRTRDIHRQVTLKLATISIGQNEKPWTDEDISEIKFRMDSLLILLDGNTTNDLSY